MENNTNSSDEDSAEINEEKRQESSQCILILLSLALSCMRKLNVRFFNNLYLNIQILIKSILYFSTYIRDLLHSNYYV